MRESKSPIHVAREFVAELLEEILAPQLLLKRLQYAFFDFIPMDRQLVQARPWSRAPKQESRFAEPMMKPALHTPHFVSPENK